jgi:oligoendopeptidase F
LANRVRNGGEKERNDYLNFLKAGSSKFPIDVLKMAGVDMTTPEPITKAIDVFKQYLNEFEKLLEETQKKDEL